MPNNLIKKWAKDKGVSVKTMEKKWDRAERLAGKQGKENNYAYRTAILKKISHHESSDFEDLRNFVMENIEIPEGIFGAAGSLLKTPLRAVGAAGNVVKNTVAAPFKAVGSAAKTVGATSGQLLRGNIKGAGQAAVGGVGNTLGAVAKPVTGAASDVGKMVTKPVDALAR